MKTISNKLTTAIAKYGDLSQRLATLETEIEKESKRTVRLKDKSDPLSKSWDEDQASLASSRARVEALCSDLQQTRFEIDSLGNSIVGEVRKIGPGVANRLRPHAQTLREDIGFILFPLCNGDKNKAYHMASEMPLYTSACNEIWRFEYFSTSDPASALQFAQTIFQTLEKLDGLKEGAPYFKIPTA